MLGGKSKAPVGGCKGLHVGVCGTTAQAITGNTRIRGPDDFSLKGSVESHYPKEEALPPELQETDWLLSVPTRSLYTESLSAVVMKFLLWSLS